MSNGEKLGILTPRLHAKHINQQPWAKEANMLERLSQFASLMSEQNGSPGGNAQRFTCLFISLFLPPS